VKSFDKSKGKVAGEDSQGTDLGETNFDEKGEVLLTNIPNTLSVGKKLDLYDRA